MEDLPVQNNEFEHLLFKLKNIIFFHKKHIFYVVGLIILSILLYFFLFSAPINFPIGTIVNVREGASLRSVSKDLSVSNIIRSRVLFETLVIFFEGEKVVSGDYLFNNKISVFEVAKRISRGEKHLASIKVTIPEGFNVFDISKAFISKLPNFNADNFLLEATKKEGYLFPDTYFFLTTDNEKDVLRFMSDNFEKKMLSIRSEIVSFGKTEKDIIIMASLIEEEAKGDIDREFISGILWKRLAIGMPLQVDAELNTYKIKGLPPNPISNPGIKSIKAAIHPKTSNYLYYLHDKDGNIHYARTFEEHKLNKQKYLR